MNSLVELQWVPFHQEIDKLKIIYKNNGHAESFVYLCIKKFLDNIFVKKEIVLKASKKELIHILPFNGNKSLQLRSGLVNSIENNLKFCQLKVIFQSPCKLNLLFCCKDSLKKEICSNIVYRYTCSNCKVTCYIKTYDHFLPELQSIWIYLI